MEKRSTLRLIFERVFACGQLQQKQDEQDRDSKPDQPSSSHVILRLRRVQT
jgi:hypothetical protein